MADTEEVEKIFSDKLKLWASIISLELRAIQSYNDIFRRVNFGEIELYDLLSDPDYYILWSQLLSLYDFLEFGGVKLLEDKKQKKLSEIIEQYRKDATKVNFNDLTLVYDTVRETMFKSGFHDLSTNRPVMRDFMKPTTQW